MNGNFKYTFGPVPSRRLGRSLGVDLVPFKTCTYDCIYCQLGRTTNKTTERKSYAPVSEVLAEAEERLKTGTPPDYITLSGSGEPTLHVGLGEIIAGIRKITGIPIAVLTNGSLLADENVREAIMHADLAIPSLDAGDDSMFQRVNRPHPDIKFEDILSGLARFCRDYRGEVWLEVFLLDGLTASDAEVARIAKCVERVSLARVQLNTVARPPAEDHARPVSMERLKRYCAFFHPQAEVIAEHDIHAVQDESDADVQAVLALLRRRPCTLEDISKGLFIHPAHAAKLIEKLLGQGALRKIKSGSNNFYKANNGE